MEKPWRRRDEEAGEREMGDGGDGEMGGRGGMGDARCTSAPAECLRGGACARIFGFVHPRTVLLGF